MHELSIATGIVTAASGVAAEHPGVVRIVRVRIGPLAGIVPEALQAAYEIARHATPLADSELVIEDVPLVGFCATCAAERPLESMQLLRCTTCGSPPLEIRRGRELELASLEIEE